MGLPAPRPRQCRKERVLEGEQALVCGREYLPANVQLDLIPRLGGVQTGLSLHSSPGLLPRLQLLQPRFDKAAGVLGACGQQRHHMIHA